jgi:hypothetical protein
MIIGLEWIIIALGFITFVLVAVGLWLQCRAEVVSAVCACLALVSIIAFGILTVGLVNAQSNVEKHYIDYLKLQTRVVQYEDLDMLEQYEVYNDVMTYNTWYNLNKADLENEWSFKGSSGYAKEFDYIVIGG